MPSTEHLYSHPARALSPTGPSAAAAAMASVPGVHGRTGSLTNLMRMPGAARTRLQTLAHQNPFVRFMDDNDLKDENDIYRQNPADQVFTFERWNKHRNSFRYAKHLAHMFSSRVFRQLLGPVLAVSALALFVGIYETLVSAGALPGHWPHVTLALGQGFNLTAFALSLLLVFRTNSSYDRWWEARKLWGGVVNRTRDLVRQSLVFFREEDVQLKELLARWTMAFPYVLMCHLRENSDVQKEVAHILTAQESAVLCAAAHRPNFVIQMLAEICRTADLVELRRMAMDNNLTFFEDAMGSMERILRTPIPLSYTRHTSRFLLVWLILLPFTLWAAYSWFSVLLSGIFAFLMFGIDEIGVQIEEPFGILPLEAISSTIERNLRELLVRNFEVTDLVAQSNLFPTSSNAADLTGLHGGSALASGGGSGAVPAGEAAAATVLVMGEEFGEMTGATNGGAAGVKDGSVAGGSLINLTASAGEGMGAAGQNTRRVQFGGATVIDMNGSSDGSGAAPSGQRNLMRQASLIEVELASGAAASPKDSGRGSVYSNWLRD